MKNNYILISLVAVLAFSSCNNDFDGFGSVKKGDVIRFVATTSDSNTRTSYGDKTDKGWPIYWVNGDNVRVVCPQAKETKTADFTVQNLSSSTNISSSTNNYTLTGDNTLLWGDDDEHHFYTFYPKERVYITDETTGTFTVAVPREQNAIVSTTGSKSEGYTFTAVDMSAAVMAGHVSVNRSKISEGETITLPFKPLTTALDIEVLAPPIKDGVQNAISEVYITSITIANPLDNVDNRVKLAGGFVYNAGANDGEGSYELYDNTFNNEDAQSTFVNVLLKEPVCLRAGTQDKLTVTAFLLPKGLPNNLRIMLNCRESTITGNMKVQSKLIEATDQQVLANVGKKLSIKMGALPNPIIFSYETWMANLDEDVYVSQISMPGTHDAGAYSSSSLGSLIAQTQYLSIEEQLNAGIRVLDFRPKYNDGNFDIAHGLITLNVTYDEIMNMAKTWLANHPTEFIIIMLKNEATSGTSNFTGWQQNMRNKILELPEVYRLNTFDPSMTIKDARGKMLFLSRDDYYGSDGSTLQGHGEWIGGKFNFGTDNNGYEDRLGGLLGWSGGSQNWTTGVFTGGQTSSIGNLFVISDRYDGPTSWGSESEEYSNLKKGDIEATIKKAGSDTDVRMWYFTFLNRSGTSGVRKVATYNEYTAKFVEESLSTSKYEKTGVVLLDWAAANITDYNDCKGYDVIQAIIDNNFKFDGPAKKQ